MYHPSELERGIEELSEEARAINNWAKTNDLALNSDKTQAIILGSAKFINKIYEGDAPVIKVGGSQIKFLEEVNYLGISIDCKLSWYNQINKTSTRIHGVIHRLKQAENILNTNMREKLVEALVYPYVDYGSVLRTGCSEDINRKLKKLINIGIRFIHSLKRDTPISEFYSELNWLMPKFRRNFLFGVLIFNILKTKRPLYLYERLIPRTKVI